VAALTGSGEFEEAGEVISRALRRCPHHPGVLAEAASLSFHQGRYGEAAGHARRFLQVTPGSGWGWNVLGASLYLQDDAVGALTAWNRLALPRIRSVRLDGFGPEHEFLIERRVGIREDSVLTVERLLIARGRLSDLPGLAHRSVAYRPVGDGLVEVDVRAVPGERSPVRMATLPAHLVRGLRGGLRLTSSDPTGRLELWELDGVKEGTFGELRAALSLPAGEAGLHRWEISRVQADFRRVREADALQLERQGLRWEYLRRDLPRVRAGTLLGADTRSASETNLVAGGTLTIDLLTPRADDPVGGIHLRLESHHPLGGQDGGDGEREWFVRSSASAAMTVPLGPAGFPRWEIEGRGGIDFLSDAAPPDLRPRFGADRSANRLMRARSAVDRDGSVRDAFPGTGWLSGGLELRRWGSGALGAFFGAAVFADAVARLSHLDGPGFGGARGGVDAGTGLRLRLPGVPGHLRLDWAASLQGDGSRVSAGWTAYRGWEDGWMH
jgi:hypothetical protein